MEKEPKNWSEHPAYKEEDLEIKNEEELKEAKEAAGVTSLSEAGLRHYEEGGLKKIINVGRKTVEIQKIMENIRTGDFIEVVRPWGEGDTLKTYGVFGGFDGDLRTIVLSNSIQDRCDKETGLPIYAASSPGIKRVHLNDDIDYQIKKINEDPDDFYARIHPS